MLQVPVKEKLPQLRMMADHARAITFLLSDGILPSNDGRGYVLRRILRRASRQGKLFGRSKPFLYTLTGKVIEIMKAGYPELEQRRENIATITKMEEEKFLETVEAGTKILEELIARYSGTAGGPASALKSQHVIPGSDVFRLYDTYGFPLDLTKEIAREQGIAIDEEGFLTAQREAQERSRASWSGSGDKDSTFYAALNKDAGNTAFKGYEQLTLQSEIVALVRDGARVPRLETGQQGEIILKETPFYAESGGQVGDTGRITAAAGALAEVRDTRKPAGGLIIHCVDVKSGGFALNDKITADVDEERRNAIRRHHTATHLLHKALRTVLGTHVTQAGSLVTPDNFRFDFTHLAALKPEELDAVESMVNDAIRRDMEVCIRSMKIDEARSMGAMALFGEKYGETVRAVSVQQSCDTPAYSMELCGGTHVSRSGEIGMFKIISESSVSAGTRRIEAVTGRAAELYVRWIVRTLDDISGRLKAAPSEAVARIDRLLSQQRDLEREVSRLKMQMASGSATADPTKSVRDVNGVKLLATKVTDLDVKSLRELADNLLDKIRSGIVVVATVEGEKASFVVTISDDQVKSGFNAGAIAKRFSSLINGSGGGKPGFAQGGGKDCAAIDAALAKLPDLLK
jgi:alanyl-tRNA synthetase